MRGGLPRQRVNAMLNDIQFAFRLLLNDARFSDLPMLLETPKLESKASKRRDVDAWDARNLRTLRNLIVHY